MQRESRVRYSKWEYREYNIFAEYYIFIEHIHFHSIIMNKMNLSSFSSEKKSKNRFKMFSTQLMSKNYKK